jgi:hypothetical protein
VAARAISRSCRGGFAAWLRCSGLCSRSRFAKRQHLGLSRRAPLDFSDNRPIVRAHYRHRHEPVLVQQTIDQAELPRAQNLLRQREKISERPNQISALHEIRLYISRTDGRVQFQNAIGKFFNPHVLPTWKKLLNPTVSKWDIIAPRTGHWEAIFLSLSTNYLYRLFQVEKSGLARQDAGSDATAAL